MPNLESDPLLKVRNPGTLLGTPRKFTKYGKSGIEVSDLYPNLGKCIDDIAVIRNMYRICGNAIQGFSFTEDWGTQIDLHVSPELFRRSWKFMGQSP